MRVVLYDVRWQVLRMSCLERNHAAGGWATVAGTTDNLDRFQKYLEDTPDPREFAVRQFRVNNCLAGIAMGYSGQGLWGSPMRPMVQEFRQRHTQGYNVLLVRSAALAWNWRRVITDLIALRQQNEPMYTALYTNLRRRTQRKANETSRMELDQFIMLMERFLWAESKP